ncbi:reverse transcriptase domain-containing protein [Tanacetum coccineum]
MNERCAAVLLNKLPSKEKDLGSFTIPCDIGQLHIDNALADLGASISLMLYMMYKKIGLGEPKATIMSLELADRSIQYLRGIIETVLIKVDKFITPIDFVILDMPEDSRVPIILGRPLLAIAQAMIDVFNKKITLRVGDDEIIFGVDQSTKRPTTEDDEWTTNIDSSSANMIDEKKQELKNLPQHLEYAYLHGEKSFPIIISSELSKKEKILLLQVLERGKGAIAWKKSDIKGIRSSYCTHKILLVDDYKSVIQPQRRLNSNVQDVVKNKIMKILDFGLIYPILDSSWVSPIHVVPKKGGMIVVLNDNNELIPSRIVTGWRVYIDYRKLNDATRKDHFPLPFIDQMLERLCGSEYYYFLDGFSVFFQIPIALEDQEKTTFTSIFQDMVEDFMEVFMEEFSMFGFDIEIKDKKGAKNLVADHLSRLENLDLGTFTEEEIIDEFPDEHLMILKAKLNNDEPWGHHSVSITRRKVYESGFYWPSIFKDAKDYGMRFLRKLFARFIVPKALISDRGTHFCNSQLEKALQKYGVTHKLSTSYHPQTNGHTELTNRAIKHILERSVGYNLKNWSEKLNEALWAFRTAYKTSTGCTPFRLVYGKAFHVPWEIEHKAYWALKQCNIDLTTSVKNHFMKLNELIELRDEAFKMHPGKLKSKWYGPNVVKTVHPYGTVEIIDKNRISFTVNGQRLKKYHDVYNNEEEKEVVELDDDTT